MESHFLQVGCREVGCAAAYLDGELSVSEEQEFERHLRACAACAASVREQRGVLCALANLANEDAMMPLPPDFARVVTVRARVQMRGSDESARQVSSRIWSLAAVCVMLAAGGVWLTNGGRAAESLFEFVARLGRLATTSLMLVWRGIDVYAWSRVEASSLIIWYAFAAAAALLWCAMREFHRRES